jgi:Flp pilus assembly protein TadD
MGTATDKAISVAVLALCLAAGAQAKSHPSKIGQGGAPGGRVTQSGKTVRRTRIADDSLARAEAAIDKKDFPAAEQALQQAVQTDPQNYRAWYDLGFVYNITGRQQEAMDAYRKSVAAKPDVFESNLNLGLILAQAGDASAEKYLRAATALKPTSNANENIAHAWLALGQLLRKSDPKRALEAYAKVSQLLPSDPEPHLSSALIADGAKDFATAENEYQAAARLDPKSVEAAAGLANVYMETQRMEEAEQALRRYLAIAEQAAPAEGGRAVQTASAHVQLGRVLLELHRRAEAITEFEEALKLAPGDPKAPGQLAWLYLQDKQYDKAEAQFRWLLEKSPKDAEMHHGLGSALLQQRKFPEAQQELIQAVQLKGDLSEAYADLASAASENKNYALTVKALDARTKFLPENPGTLFLRATALDHLGDKVNASNSYRDFLAASNGKYPDQEWQARHRLIAIDPKKK